MAALNLPPPAGDGNPLTLESIAGLSEATVTVRPNRAVVGVELLVDREPFLLLSHSAAVDLALALAQAAAVIETSHGREPRRVRRADRGHLGVAVGRDRPGLSRGRHRA